MQVDVQSLGTFNQLAHEGAQAATRSMATMTGIDASVDVTRISLMDREDLGEELDDGRYVGVRFDFEGTIGGESVLVFDRASTDDIVDALVPGEDADDELARSSVEEVGNIMMSGFIDGWADYLETTIEHSPPEYVATDGASVLPTGPEGSEYDQLFVFRSEVEFVGETVNFYIYMVPEYEDLATLLARQSDADGTSFSIEKLEVFNRMTRTGTETAAEHLGMMADLDVDAEVTRLNFAPIESIPKQIGTEPYVGTVVEFTGIPSGYLLVLFDEASARTVAESLMPVETVGTDLTDRHEDAIVELGNIMTSGFLDGWANVLQRSVDHSPPQLVHDMGRAIVDPIAAQLGQVQRHAFVIDSIMRTDAVAFECQILALPNERELQEALDELLVDRADQTDADVEQIF